MNVLVLGSGGREHTFAWKIANSPLCGSLFVAPGNSGTAGIATNLEIGVNDFQSIKKAVLKYDIQMVIVGPEDPLVRGIHDFFLTTQR
jgi:phosphoribosylamine--glycine ligase